MPRRTSRQASDLRIDKRVSVFVRTVACEGLGGGSLALSGYHREDQGVEA